VITSRNCRVIGADGYLERVMSVADARALAEARLRPLGRRWTHTVAVAERAEVAGKVLTVDERAVVVSAAFVHDLGYAEGIADSGFHHLDGARFLRDLGEDRLAGLVAFHSAGRWEAEARGVTPELAEFEDERSLTADVLAYADLLTGPDGTSMELAARIGEVERRYGAEHPVTRSLRAGQPDLAARLGHVQALLAEEAGLRR
jgi:hypothetical protein